MPYSVQRKFFISILVLSIGLVAASLVAFAMMQWSHRIRNITTLKVVGVGVYKDANFTLLVTEIDWGVVEAGETKDFSVYIKNESNVPLSLAMRTESWEPANASSFVSLAWDYSEELIPVDSSVPMTFTLSVDSAISGITSFSFTIVIIGSG